MSRSIGRIRSIVFVAGPIIAALAVVIGANIARAGGPGRSAVMGMPVKERGERMAPSPKESAIESITARCQECHDFDETASHPVDVVPKRPLPAALPLENGRMTCLTCHTDAQGAHFQKNLRDGKALRDALAGASSACVVCHAPEDASKDGRRARGHAMTLRTAHLKPSRTKGNFPRAMPIESPLTSHRNTQTCLACHDGVMSNDTGVGANLAMRMGVGTLREGHPIDVAYPANGRAVSSTGNPFRLHPRDFIDPQIELPGGKVGCASCHSLYSRNSSLLMMSNEGSRLCLSCHAQ